MKTPPEALAGGGADCALGGTRVNADPPGGVPAERRDPGGSMTLESSRAASIEASWRGEGPAELLDPPQPHTADASAADTGARTIALAAVAALRDMFRESVTKG